MAVDTKAKRSAVQNYGGFSQMRPPPDGTVGEGDRAQLAWLYQGMDYDNPVASTSVLSWFLDFRTFTKNFFKGGFN